MRFIGNLPSEKAATTFGNVLLASGIEHRIEKEPGCWAVWVLSEEDFGPVAELLSRFLEHPDSKEFEARAREGAVRRRMLEEDAAGGRDLSGRAILRRAFPDGVGALTAVLTGTCLAIAFAAWAGYDDRVFEELLITRMKLAGKSLDWNRSLPEIFQQGEFWRLITPALVHFKAVHLLINLICLIDLGSAVEGREGTGRLGFLFVVLAVGSNLTQTFFGGPAFCGVSGVLYGLLGYIWMKGKFDPGSGLNLHPYTVVLMLVFFALGLGDAFKPVLGVAMANGAHAGGLLLGMLFGVLASIPALRRRRGKV